MMTHENNIAQAEYWARCDKFDHPKAVEGITVKVPNAIDRAWLAVRKALPLRAESRRKASRWVTRGAPAK